MNRPIVQAALKSLVAAGVLLATFAAGSAPAFAAAAPGQGAVYTETNDSSANAVLIFARHHDGALTAAGAVSTGGRGTGRGLGSQGALILDVSKHSLFAVNAGSNEISSFAVAPRGALTLIGTYPSGGTDPISLTANDDNLYVLNAGGDGNITGFHIERHGGLHPLAGSTQPLSSAGGAGPAEVAFNPTGAFLVVTEKTNNKIDVYPVRHDGVAGPPATYPASGNVPFGFAFARHGDLIVSEAGSGAVSSYQLPAHGRLMVISGSVSDGQAAPCWIAVSRDNAYAYTTNAAGDNISSYAVSEDGHLRLIGVAATTGAGSHPTDMAFSQHSRYLYVLGAVSHTISGFARQSDGSLVPAGTTGVLPATTVGLAAD